MSLKDGNDDITSIFAALVGMLFLVVCVLRIVNVFNPPIGPNTFKSFKYTGWSNLRPSKLATARTMEVISGVTKPDNRPFVYNEEEE